MSSLDLYLFNTPVSFNRNAAFNTQAASLVTGNRFSASTLRGQKILTISMEGPEPDAGSQPPGREEVVKIPTAGKQFKINHDPAGKKTLISFGGDEPPTVPGSVSPPAIGESLDISLDGTRGDWQWRIDPGTGDLTAIFACFPGEEPGNKPKP